MSHARTQADRLAPGPHHHQRQGRTPTHGLREIFNAILDVNRTGIAWRDQE